MRLNLSPVFVVAIAATASASPLLKDTLDCYGEPNVDSFKLLQYLKGQDVSVHCKTTGFVDQSLIFGRTSEDCYVLQNALGSDLGATPQCEEVDELLENRDVGLVIRADDYPYVNKCGQEDKWGFDSCTSESYVAWRLNEEGIKFKAGYKGGFWGSAKTWDTSAKVAGITVNKVPQKGSVAQNDSGTKGHVAWVASVSGLYVNIEEYNYATSEGYGKRKVLKSKFNYIHF